jgi:hypothetical protein
LTPTHLFLLEKNKRRKSGAMIDNAVSLCEREENAVLFSICERGFESPVFDGQRVCSFMNHDVVFSGQT